MLILGIDPSLNSTAWAVLEERDRKFILHDKGLISFKAGGEIYDKIMKITSSIYAVIKQYSICTTAIEETIVNKNPSSSLKLGMVRGACMAVSSMHNIPVVQYKPNIIKATITGNGHADKAQVSLMVSRFLSNNDISFATYDESDAIATAMTHLFLMQSKIYRIQNGM